MKHFDAHSFTVSAMEVIDAPVFLIFMCRIKHFICYTLGAELGPVCTTMCT